MFHHIPFKFLFRGAWVAQSVKPLSLGFSSGQDPQFCEFEPWTGFCADSVEPVWDSVSPSLSLPLLHSLSLSLSVSQINKLKNFFFNFFSDISAPSCFGYSLSFKTIYFCGLRQILRWCFTADLLSTAVSEATGRPCTARWNVCSTFPTRWEPTQT